ncbi:AP-1-like transcription factor [Hanseniaspora osmophila]|uniref:AP-1-like transcription factor n=1 Tax=Hanseniaspora osmophila TaxID=56408 RepID=A0A1E5R0Y9_9ASCO|nr:AP-1-like transcription factor [Hanseniaspora osmophila]
MPVVKRHIEDVAGMSPSESLKSGDLIHEKKVGRKPLTDTNVKDKRTQQNRAAQRAFRERKEQKLKELESKVESLETINKQQELEQELLKEQLSVLLKELSKYKQTSSTANTSANKGADFKASSGFASAASAKNIEDAISKHSHFFMQNQGKNGSGNGDNNDNTGSSSNGDLPNTNNSTSDSPLSSSLSFNSMNSTYNRNQERPSFHSSSSAGSDHSFTASKPHTFSFPWKIKSPQSNHNSANGTPSMVDHPAGNSVSSLSSNTSPNDNFDKLEKFNSLLSNHSSLTDLYDIDIPEINSLGKPKDNTLQLTASSSIQKNNNSATSEEQRLVDNDLNTFDHKSNKSLRNKQEQQSLDPNYDFTNSFDEQVFCSNLGKACPYTPGQSTNELLANKSSGKTENPGLSTSTAAAPTEALNKKSPFAFGINGFDPSILAPSFGESGFSPSNLFTSPSSGEINNAESYNLVNENTTMPEHVTNEFGVNDDLVGLNALGNIGNKNGEVKDHFIIDNNIAFDSFDWDNLINNDIALPSAANNNWDTTVKKDISAVNPFELKVRDELDDEEEDINLLKQKIKADEDDNEVVPSTDGDLLNCSEVWDRITTNPKFTNIDIDGLCSELRLKAKCSDKGPVVKEQDMYSLLKQHEIDK